MTGALIAEIVASVLGLCGTVLSGLRFLRVAQREHYLPGAPTRFARRWWGADPLEGALFVCAVVSIPGALVVPGLSGVAGLVAAILPRRLSVRGRTSPLAWTRRLRTLALASGLIAVVLLAIGALAGGVEGVAIAAGAAGLVTPLLIDLCLVVLAPLEDRIARRYLTSAQDRLRRVAPRIVAITGSYGKTTTKGYVAHLLSGRYRVVASPASYNNRAGLSRTVNENLLPGTEVLVAEMGTYGPGEIAGLCDWLTPTIAVITAIGPVHLERFGTVENIVAAKSEITNLADVVVLNVGDARLAGLAATLAAENKHVVRCSSNPGSRAEVDVLLTRLGRESSGELHRETGLETLLLVLGGTTQWRIELAPSSIPAALSNVACAVAVALELGVAPEECLARLGDLPGAANRLSVERSASGVVVLDDTFNSNPAGARLALGALARLAAPGHRTVVVTPGMVELGPLQELENESFAADAARIASTVVIVARTNRRALLRGVKGVRASQHGEASEPEVVVVDRREDAVAWVRRHCGGLDVVLYENDLPDHFP